jgi:hypothetical protein
MSEGIWQRLISRVRWGLDVCCRRDHLRATGGIALVVGTWLTLINQADIFLAQGFSMSLAMKVTINYLTPFVVSNLGLISHKA